MKDMPTRWELDDKDFCYAYYCEKCESNEMHWHTHHLMTFYTAGNGILNINGMNRKVSKGDLVVLSNVDFHKHTIRENENLSFYSIKFHYDRCSSQIQELIGAESFPILAHLEKKQLNLAQALMDYMCDEYAKAKESDKSYISCNLAIEQLLVMSHRYRSKVDMPKLFSDISTYKEKIGMQKTNGQIYQALRYIQLHFREPSTTVSDVAAEVGYTEHYFSEIFKKHLGCSCKLYIQKYRLEFAKRLLRLGNMPITQVCYESGFQDLSYFVSTFRKAYGCSPGKYGRL